MATLDSDLRVLVVSDHPYTRAGIINALSNQPLIRVVGQSASDAPLPELVALFSPEVIVWELPYESPQPSSRLTELRDISTPVLVLLSDEERSVELLASGVRGLLPQNADAETICAAVKALAMSLIVVDVSFPLIALNTMQSVPALPSLDILTQRELEVLRLVAEGLPNKQIAVKLSISEHTIKFHINAIMGKLGVQSRTEAVVRATRMGLIAL